MGWLMVRPLLLVLLLATAGCPPEECADYAATSVAVTVTYTTPPGDFEAIEVTYTVDGGPVTVAECWDDSDPCTSWSAGTEEPGTFVVTARMGERTASATAVVTVGEDGCHVLGQQVTLDLN
jgi:hypothetical protein